jgi:hypothetical protein
MKLTPKELDRLTIFTMAELARRRRARGHERLLFHTAPLLNSGYRPDLIASTARPERILLGFARLSLAPGQARKVTFTVHPSRLAFYDPCMRFVTEPGTFTFSVGSSAASIRAEKTVTLDGPVAEYRQRVIVATKTTIP